MKQRTFWFTVALVAAVTLFAVIVFWATQFVWIPIILTGITMLVREYRTCSRIEWPKYVIFVGVGVVSTFVQFFTTEMVFGLTLGKLFLVLGVAVLVIYMIGMAVVSILQDIAERSEKRKKQRQLAEEEKCHNELHQSFTALLNKAHAAVNVQWEDVVTLETQRQQLKLNRATLHNVYTKVDLFKLIEISEVKKQVIWKNSDFGEALCHFNQVIKDSFDDRVLEILIKRIEALGKLSTYKGYERMHQMVSERIISDLIRLPYPAEKQMAH